MKHIHCDSVPLFTWLSLMYVKHVALIVHLFFAPLAFIERNELRDHLLDNLDSFLLLAATWEVRHLRIIWDERWEKIWSPSVTGVFTVNIDFRLFISLIFSDEGNSIGPLTQWTRLGALLSYVELLRPLTNGRFIVVYQYWYNLRRWLVKFRLVRH